MASIISAGTTAGTALNLSGDTSGNLAFTTGAGANTITVPNTTGTIITTTGGVVPGTSGNVLTSNGTTWTSAAGAYPLTSGTAQASTSGTSIDFTSIPSWVKRITVMFNGVSTNGSALPIVRLGVSGTPQTTGYQGIVANQGTTAAAYLNLSSGFAVLQSSGASVVFYGQMIISSVGSNIWVATGQVGRTDNTFLASCQGGVSLSGALNMVRITTDNGTDTFDAGSINILYE